MRMVTNMLITNLKDLENENKISTYSCGSQKLSHAIRTQLNMVPIQVYKHRANGKLVNVFIMTEELSRFLTEWTNNNPKKHKGVVNG